MGARFGKIAAALFFVGIGAICFNIVYSAVFHPR
jgi:hypothetical protein